MYDGYYPRTDNRSYKYAPEIRDKAKAELHDVEIELRKLEGALETIGHRASSGEYLDLFQEADKLRSRRDLFQEIVNAEAGK